MTNVIKSALPFRASRRGGMGLPTALSLLSSGTFCYAAWLTSIVFNGAAGHYPLLIAGALFWPVGIVHGVGVWFGGW